MYKGRRIKLINWKGRAYTLADFVPTTVLDEIYI